MGRETHWGSCDLFADRLKGYSIGEKHVRKKGNRVFRVVMTRTERWWYVKQFNLLKTIWVNFRLFPFREAIKMPVWIFGKFRLGHVYRGCIEFNCPVVRGLLRLGFDMDNPVYITSLVVWGKIKVNGHVFIHSGTHVGVAKGALLELGNHSAIGACGKVRCENHIIIGDHARISWECQVFDTDFHYIEYQGVVRRKDSPVFIGHHCWLGNRITVNKGSRLPPHSIVASNSLVNKDFSDNGPSGLYAGVPARFVKGPVNRIWGYAEGNINALFEHGIDERPMSQVQEVVEAAQSKHDRKFLWME